MTTFYCNNIADSLRVNVATGAYVLLTPSQETTDGTNINVNPSVKIPITIASGTASFSQAVVDCQTQLPHFLYTVQIFSQGALVYNQTGVAITGASYNLASFIPGSQGGTSGVTVPTLQTNGTNNTDQLILNLKQGSNITLAADGAGGVTITGAGAAGGVTSVGLADSTGLFTITGSPVTTAGTLTLSAFASQTQNTFLAAPNGSNGPMTVRAIVAADIPTLNQNTTGSAGSVAAANVTAGTMQSGMILVAPALGTPASGTLTNCTFPTLNQNTTGSAASLSISGQTGLLTVTGLTSTNRVKTVRDAADTILELGGSYTPTGTWTSMTLVTPALGTPASGVLTNCSGTAASLTAGAVTGLSVTSGKTLTVSNSITLAGTDSTTMTFPSASATITQTIGSGTQALNTAAIASGAKSTIITTAVTGVLSTDTLSADFNTDPSSTTGYAPSASGMLTIIKWCTAGNINFYQYNNTGASITPGAMTLNWKVTR